HRDIQRYGVGIDLEIEPDPFNRIGVHHRGRDLTQINAEIDLVPRSLLRQQFMNELYRFDAPSQAVERRSVRPALRVARFDADQRRDHLQIVFDAVLDLQKQHVFLTNALLEFFTLCPRMRTDFDECCEPEGGRPAIILDHIGIDIDECGFAPRPRDPERADEILRLHDRVAKLKRVRTVALALEETPTLSFELARALAGQFLELRIGVSDALGVLHLRDDDRNRDLIEKVPELLAFERIR